MVPLVQPSCNMQLPCQGAEMERDAPLPRVMPWAIRSCAFSALCLRLRLFFRIKNRLQRKWCNLLLLLYGANLPHFSMLIYFNFSIFVWGTVTLPLYDILKLAPTNGVPIIQICALGNV